LRVVILAWEFPPRIVGQLAHYVNSLAVELVRKNVDVHVITYHDSWVGYHQGADGVKAYRVSNPVKAQISVLTWALTLNQEVERAAADIYHSTTREVELIDAHDWHFVPAAVSLKSALGVPFVFSVDSLENHRSRGSNAPLSLSIKGLESLGLSEAARVVVRSDWMRNEVNRVYGTPFEKIEVVSPYSPEWAEQVLRAYWMARGHPPECGRV